MGQVWSSADFDGIPELRMEGGAGSCLAVTAQNSGGDGLPLTADDVLAPLNEVPVPISIDRSADENCRNQLDRVRSFYSFHTGGGFFVFGDGSVRLLEQDIDPRIYIGMSTINGREVIPAQ